MGCLCRDELLTSVRNNEDIYVDMLRVGIIGVGVMGERHCRVYSSLRNVQVVGIADLDATRGQAVAASTKLATLGRNQKSLVGNDLLSQGAAP